MTIVRHINHELRDWAKLRERLFAARLNSGFSQDRVAADANLSSRTTLGRIERGESIPGVDTLIALANSLGLSVELVPTHQRRLLGLTVDEVKALIHAASRAADDPLLLTMNAKHQARQAVNAFYNGRR